ncbi:MAG: hypothetical protein ACK4SA_13250 [Caldilinea sp.]
MTTPDERQPLIADRLQRAAETLADARLLLQHSGSPFRLHRAFDFRQIGDYREMFRDV